MILRLGLNEMDCNAASRCLPSSCVSPIIRGTYSATAARPPTSWTPTIPSGPTSSNMTRHFILNSRLQRPGSPIAPPTFWTVSARIDAVRIGNEVETLYTNGPAGGGGAWKQARQVVAVVSTLVPRDAVQPQVSYEVA